MFKKLVTSALLATVMFSGVVAVPGVIETPAAEASYPLDWYKQTDSRWANDLMGGGGRIYDYGCTITSVANGLSGKGIWIDGANANPKTFNTWLKNNGGYSGNFLVWTAVPKLNSRIQWIGRYDGGTSVSASQLRSWLDNGKYLIIGQVRGGSHWVALENHNGVSTFYVHDPSFSNTYYNYSDFTGYGVYYIN